MRRSRVESEPLKSPECCCSSTVRLGNFRAVCDELPANTWNLRREMAESMSFVCHQAVYIQIQSGASNMLKEFTGKLWAPVFMIGLSRSHIIVAQHLDYVRVFMN